MTTAAPKGLQGRNLYLIDGNAFCYRAFYAIPGLANSKGEPTNAIYGFITMVRRLLDERKPDCLAVCFDPKGKTFRYDQYEDYKAHRKPMPDDLVGQIEPIKEFCRILKLPLFEKTGFEADDVIGTLATKAEAEGMKVFIATGDKDAFQLVSDRVKVIHPHKENLIFDTEKVKQWLDGHFEDDLWSGVALRCLGCASCIYQCPTCHCFDIVDEATWNCGQRVRNWDSCSFSQFTRHGSGHNPRPLKKVQYSRYKGLTRA